MRVPIFDLQYRQARAVEQEGFFHGAHGIAPEIGTAEIDASFEGKCLAARQSSLSRLKPLEAKLEYLTAATAAVEEAWRSIQTLINPHELRVAMPAFAAFVGAAALATEVILLAPSLDLLDVTDPALQFVGALGLVSFASVFLHFAWETIEENSYSHLSRIVWRVIGALSIVALVLWGILRGYQVAFAANIHENQLGRFLAGHPLLSSTFYVFVSLGAPLAAAGAFTQSSRHFRDWYRFRKAQQRADQHSREVISTRKKVEAETEWIRHELNRLDHERREAVAAYLRQHERGQKNGAIQSPFWLVQAKATLSAMLTLLVAWWAFALSPFSFLLPAIAYLGAFIYFRHQRIHPMPAEFYDLEKVKFVETSDGSDSDHFLPPLDGIGRLEQMAEVLNLPQKRGD